MDQAIAPQELHAKIKEQDKLKGRIASIEQHLQEANVRCELPLCSYMFQ